VALKQRRIFNRIWSADAHASISVAVGISEFPFAAGFGMLKYVYLSFQTLRGV
jgi:hypothetical protein